VFSNLSVRVPGNFKLRFQLVDLASKCVASVFVRLFLFCITQWLNKIPRVRPDRLMDPGSSKSVEATAWTEAFQVYQPKKYPGNVKVRYLFALRLLAAVSRESLTLLSYA